MMLEKHDYQVWDRKHFELYKNLSLLTFLIIVHCRKISRGPFSGRRR